MTFAIPSLERSSVVAALTHRSLAERRRFIAGLALAAFAMAAMVAALYSSMGAAYDDLFENMPAAVVGMLGSADLSTAEGFLQVELFSIVAPGLAIAAGVVMAAGALAGAEQSGRLAMITTSPLRRNQVVTASIAATAVAVTAVAVALLAGILAGSAVGGLDVAIARVVAACFSLTVLGLVVGLIALAAGAITGRRSAALGSSTAVAVASYAIDAFFPLSSTLEPFSKLSLWYPFAHNQPLVNGLDPSHVAVLAAIGIIAAAVAYWGFERRDLAT